jgi:hypothetical protein
MVKFTATTTDARKVIGLGLSRENVRRLIAGEPIVFPGEAIGEAHRDFLIFFGETEAQLREQFREGGLLGPETIEHGEWPDA